MEEFAEGGRLSPVKVKEFIPAGTLGIGVDGNVWLRKSRQDGKTYWTEFIETSNNKMLQPIHYNLKEGILFSTNKGGTGKFGFILTYEYSVGFAVSVFYRLTNEPFKKYERKNAQEFRDSAIFIRENEMDGQWTLQNEFTQIVAKLTTAFEKGELRQEFTEETPENEPKFKIGDIVKVVGAERKYKVIDVLKRSGNILVKTEAIDDESIENVYSQDELELSNEIPQSKFEIGDYVKVKNDLQQVMYAYSQQEKYKFDNPKETVNVKNGTEGYVVGIYYESEYNEIRIVVKKLDNGGATLEEFIIAEQGLELVSKALKVGDTVYVKDVTYLYPTAPKLKTELEFKDPNSITKGSEVSYTTGEVFVVGQSPQDLMPIYGVNVKVLFEQILIGAQGLELVAIPKDNLERTKIQVNNPEENKLIQEYAFSLGYYWLGVDRNIVQEFDKYPAYIEFTKGQQIFSPLNKKEFDKTYKKEVTLEQLGLISPKPIESPTEFVCNVDSTKINSPFVSAFYSKNKARIEKLKSEFSCKILESLVYLSDYENCGGGVQLPIQEVIEEDDLLGAIRNLK